MKKATLFLLALICISSLFAQEQSLQYYVIHFIDKGANSDAGFNPSSYLTEKSVERRIRQKIAFDQSDIPVNEQYVKDVAKTGARILTRSRWFNTIIIETTPEAADVISSKSFVSKIQSLDKGTNQVEVNSSVKPFFEAEKVSPWTAGIPKKSTTDLYDYGAAYNQINQLNGQYLHNNGFSGQGMTIAVIDAGFNSVDIMPCFDSLRANNQIKGTRDFAQPGNNVYATSMHSHGTSVLSCMGAYVSGQMIGTAPKADYWLLRSEVGESESIIEEYYWVSAAEFADSIGADLINSSLGYTVFPDSPEADHTYADMDGNTTVVTIGADKAAEKGILVVNSAGNSGGFYDPWKYIGAPADGDSVFSIGAVDFNGNRAGFSSLGPTYDRRIKPTVAAQGENSALYFPSGLGYGNGTSFSSPITCGMTACLWQAIPEFNNMEIIETIKLTSSQGGQQDSLLGWGIPNYQKAYTTRSVYEKHAEILLSSYPNPVIDNVTVYVPVPVSGKFTIEFIDLQGRAVYKKAGIETSVRSFQINDIGNLPSGIYLLKLSAGSLTYTGKIVKK